jgi:hypothetical protein
MLDDVRDMLFDSAGEWPSNCDRATLERLLGPERVQQVRAFHDESDEEGAGSDEQLLRVLRDLRDVLNKRLPG